MRKALLGTALALGLAVAATPAAAQFGPAGCTRDGLAFLADKYVEAQKQGMPLALPLGTWANYYENMELSGMGAGVISKSLNVDFHRAILDEASCQVFVEATVTDPAHPYVLGALIASRGGEVNTIEILATDKGDWLFNAALTKAYSQAEDWSVIPEADRDSRETIMAAANAYLDLFSDPTVEVPWGAPCQRLEGGLYTGKDGPGKVSPDDTCNVGVPDNIEMAERRYIVDPTIGAVTVLLKMGPNQRPDSHTFRVEKGKLRYVHTITVCQDEMCGFTLDASTKKRLEG